MSVLTNQFASYADYVSMMQYQANKNLFTITGTILTRPTLMYGDSTSLTYCADVDVGITGYDFMSSQQVNMPLKNVPISQASHDLIYADVGMPVTLTRSHSGKFEITGFAKTKTGTYHRLPVCLDRNEIGTPVDISMSTHILTLAELQDYAGGFGSCPFGAYALFRGSTFLEIRW
jgi:hypothetical protein